MISFFIFMSETISRFAVVFTRVSVIPHTISPSLSAWTRHTCSQWSHGFMLFMPISQPTNSMLEQKPGFIIQRRASVPWFWRSRVCCFVILFLAVRLGLLLSICFKMPRVVCSEMLCSTSVSAERCLFAGWFPTCWVELTCDSPSDFPPYESIFACVMAADWVYFDSLHSCLWTPGIVVNDN